MKKLLTIFICLVAAVSMLGAQEADSLLIMDFEDGLGAWGEKFTDATTEIGVIEGPLDESNKVLECYIDSDLGPKGGFVNRNLNIVVNGDTASALVIYVYVPIDFLDTALGVQIFAQDRVTWNWQNTWYNPEQLIAEAWNRLVFDFESRFETIEGYDISGGHQAGVEFVLLENSKWFDAVYADNIYLLGVSGAASAVKEAVATIPTTLELEQNYPNPFNPTTNIIYRLSHRDVVTVSVFDVNGRLVSTIIKNEIQPAGKIALQFDASNLSSGVYFYKVQTTNNVQVKKMIFVQ